MDNQPFLLEDFLASVVEALKVRGDSRAIAAILEGECRLEQWNHDFGIDYWRLIVALPSPIFYAVTDQDWKTTEDTLEKIIRPFFVATPSDGLDGVVVTPKVASANQGWREEALRFIKGEGVTNQGRVRSDNIAAKQHQGLLFRSKSEIILFEALTRAQLAVAPLPVFVRVGKSYNRIEPDFVVIFKGLTFVVEVDGDTFHKELPAEADKRLVPLTWEGVEVKRIRATDLETASAADLAVRDLISFMRSRKESR